MKQKTKSALQVKLVSWPTPQDYNEALQNPKQSFSDPALMAGKPALTPLGLPKPMTGAFASVYRMHCKDKDWAVRCFLRNFPDQHDRYAKIEDHLVRAKLPFTVGFDYIEDGLRLHNERYPILKMEWAEGQHLDEFIAHNLHNPKLLSETADAWKKMLCTLRENHIAHGDLQHGNVLVDNKNFELVDYDGMYVPSLEGMDSNELGHRNYQHPGRTKEHFGLYLDNFAGWLIYVSLKLLSIDPSLWQELEGGDECLLFRQQDLKDPMNSVAFSILEHHKSSEIQQLSRLIRSFLQVKVENVPGLDTNPIAPNNLPEVPTLAKLLAKVETDRIVFDKSKLPAWMTDAPIETEQNSQTKQPQSSKRATWPPARGTFSQSYYSSYSPGSGQSSKQATWPPPRYGGTSQKSSGSPILDFMKYWHLGTSDMILALILAIIWIPIAVITLIMYLANSLGTFLAVLGWEWSWPLWLYASAAIPIVLYYIVRYWPRASAKAPQNSSQLVWTAFLIWLVFSALAFFIVQASKFDETLQNKTDIVAETENQVRVNNDAIASESLNTAGHLLELGNYDEAIGLYKQALAKYVANYPSAPEVYFPEITKTLDTIAECYQKTHSFKTANRYLSKSAELTRLHDAGRLTDKDLFVLP